MWSPSRTLWSNLIRCPRSLSLQEVTFYRNFADKSKDKKGCRRALADIPSKPPDDICSQPCITKTKKPGILHKIKLKVWKDGSNFGTPFEKLKCEVSKVVGEKKPKQKALAPPKKAVKKLPKPRTGMQVAVLGADTPIGQFVALLLKQCSCIKKLRLYEATDCGCCNRTMCHLVNDLQHIDTNCQVEAYSCRCCDLDRCLQNTDIVLILENCYVSADMPYERRFQYQAPIIKYYADVISCECPKAFIVVCATPTDCMVPLIAETLKETGWYNRHKLLGSVAVAEMRASTLAARALGLEPRYTRVPCVGGTEGHALVPLFSRAVKFFDFAQNNAILMTNAVRQSPVAVKRIDDDCCLRAGDLSEAHAVAGLVINVAHALLCNDMPTVSGFVETDFQEVVSPARYIANRVKLSGTGVIANYGLPKLNDLETGLLDGALNELYDKQKMVSDWYSKYCRSSGRLDASQVEFFQPRSTARFDDCAYATIKYFTTSVVLSGTGIVKQYDLPPSLSSLEQLGILSSWEFLNKNIKVAEEWFAAVTKKESDSGLKLAQKQFFKQEYYERIDKCMPLHLS